MIQSLSSILPHLLLSLFMSASYSLSAFYTTQLSKIQNLWNVRVVCALIEDTTPENAGTNGESVMMYFWGLGAVLFRVHSLLLRVARFRVIHLRTVRFFFGFRVGLFSCYLGVHLRHSLQCLTVQYSKLRVFHL